MLNKTDYFSKVPTSTPSSSFRNKLKEDFRNWEAWVAWNAWEAWVAWRANSRDDDER